MLFKKFTPKHLAWLDAHFDEIQRDYQCKWAVLAEDFSAAFPQDVNGREVTNDIVQRKLLRYWVCYCGGMLQCVIKYSHYIAAKWDAFPCSIFSAQGRPL
jgi:hypothetical protein